MRLVSSRDPDGRAWTFRDALFQGLAPDGGLFTPRDLEPLPLQVWAGLRGKPIGSVAAAAAAHLIGDEVGPERAERWARHAVDFPFPLTRISESEHVLELFHGPTLAFKDVGARFMSAAMADLQGPASGARTVLVATSGDTGGAVAQAFRGQAGLRVVILFPQGKVSPRQRAQLTTGGPSVRAAAVEGGFDDCQRIVKEAFADSALRSRHGLTSANSINIGRLLPQTFYYLYGALALQASESRLMVSVPSGNLGNLTAGLLARMMGAPIDILVAGTNANRTLVDYMETGVLEPRPSVHTLSNAMDVGSPSNLERMLTLYPEHRELRRAIRVSAWSDDQTLACISQVYGATGVVLDPHTAVGLLALREARSDDRDVHGMVLGTAHPAKFPEVVEPVIGQPVPVPECLREAMKRDEPVPSIPPSLEGLISVLESS